MKKFSGGKTLAVVAVAGGAILASIALVFFLGFIAKMVLLGK